MKVVSDMTQLSQTFSVSGSETKKKASVFDTILAATNSSEEAAIVDAHEYVEPAGVHRSKNVIYLGGDVIFPPVGTPKEFLKVWDSTLDALDPVSRGELEGAISDGMIYGDYRHEEPNMSAEESAKRAIDCMKTMSFEDIIQVGIEGLQHRLKDTVEAGHEQIYVDWVQQRIDDIEKLLDNWLKAKPDDDVVDLLLKDK